MGNEYRLKRDGEYQWDVIPSDRRLPCGGVVLDWDGFYRAFICDDDWDCVLDGWYETRVDAARAVWDNWHGVCMWEESDWRTLESAARRLAPVWPDMPAVFDDAIGQHWSEGVFTGIWWSRLVEAVGFPHALDEVSFEEWTPCGHRMDMFVPDRLVVEQKRRDVDLDHTGRTDYPTVLSQLLQYASDLHSARRETPWYAACNYRVCRIYEGFADQMSLKWELDLTSRFGRMMLLIWLRHIIAREPLEDSIRRFARRVVPETTAAA